MSSNAGADDTVDLGEVAGALRRGARWIVGGVAVGVAAALAALWLVPAEYEARSTVLVRESSGGAGSALSRLSGLADLVPGMGGMGTSLDTEVEILTSRAVIGDAVDSLGLQVMVRTPRSTAPGEIFSALKIDPEIRDAKYSFRREGEIYRVDGSAARAEVRPGVPYQLPGAVVTLRSGELPEEFEIQLVDRETAIDEVTENLTAAPSGEVVELGFKAPDRWTAAQLPNLLVERYLERRRTVDRGANQRRYEFLRAHADSLSSELMRAEVALRTEQERSGMLDPELSGRTELERATVIQTQLERVDVEARALEQVLARRTASNGSPRELAAYPTFLQNPAINAILEQMHRLDTERVALLQKRTEEDDEVIALSEGVRNLENQLVSISRDYLNGLTRQRAELQAELQTYSGVLGALPAQAMESLRRQREVRRLSETMMALQTQLVTARLGAIGEGGDVRQIDAAKPPKRASFPSLPIFLVVGIVGGLVLGAGGALGSEYFGSKVRTPAHAQLATGVPALALRPGSPLLLGGLEECRSVLVVAVGKEARAGEIAHSLAHTSSLRGVDVALVDVESAVARLQGGSSVAALPPGYEEESRVELTPLDGAEGDFPVVRVARGVEIDPGELRATLGRLEERLHTVIVALSGAESPLTLALLGGGRPVVLAARIGAADRAELRDAVDTLRRAGMSVAGVILHNGDGGDHSGA